MDIINEVKNIPIFYHESIFRILSQYKVDYTKNRNGTFINLENVTEAGLEAVRQHIENIYTHIRSRAHTHSQTQVPLPQYGDVESIHVHVPVDVDVNVDNVNNLAFNPKPIIFLDPPKRRKAVHVSKRHQAIIAAIRRIERESRVTIPVNGFHRNDKETVDADKPDNSFDGEVDGDGDGDVDIDDGDVDIDIDATLDLGLGGETGEADDNLENDGELGEGDDESDGLGHKGGSDIDGEFYDGESALGLADIVTSEDTPEVTSSSKFVPVPNLCAFLRKISSENPNSKIDKLSPSLRKLNFPIPHFEM